MKENFLISTSGEHYLKNWNKWKEEVNESLVTASNWVWSSSIDMSIFFYEHISWSAILDADFNSY